MKTKFIQPPREFGFAGDTFNLAGETLRTPEKPQLASEDSTLALFDDPEPGHLMIQKDTGRQLVIQGAKNANAAKYQAAKMHGGKPGDYVWNWRES